MSDWKLNEKQKIVSSDTPLPLWVVIPPSPSVSSDNPLSLLQKHHTLSHPHTFTPAPFSWQNFCGMPVNDLVL